MNTLSTFSHQPLKLNSKFILFFAMLFVTASIAADTVAYKFCSMGPLIESGATVIFPLTYVLGDILTEVYGYSVARKVIWLGLICELLFACLVRIVIKLPTPMNIPYQHEYKDILNPILIFVLSGIVADIVSSFTNIYLISKFKIFLKGKAFILRSIGSTAIAELIMNIVICFLAFSGFMSIKNVIHVMISAYILEMIYACIFVIPAQFACIILKRAEKIDAYDDKTDYNIFSLN